MAAVVIVVNLTMQFLLYWQPYRLDWLTTTLADGHSAECGRYRPWILAGCRRLAEIQRLIGGPLLTSVLLGTYHRPVRRRLIVMFLDLAQLDAARRSDGRASGCTTSSPASFSISTSRSAEFGGAVHAYVGDEVIVGWPVSDDKARNARAIACFFAIDRKIAQLAPEYEARVRRHPGVSRRESTPGPSSSANAATPSASSPISATP